MLISRPERLNLQINTSTKAFDHSFACMIHKYVTYPRQCTTIFWTPCLIPLSLFGTISTGERKFIRGINCMDYAIVMPICNDTTVVH